MYSFRNNKKKNSSKLPSALYTIQRTPVSQKEVSFEKKTPNPLVIWLKQKAAEILLILRKKRKGRYRRPTTPSGVIVAQATARRRVSDNLLAGGTHTSKRVHRKKETPEWLPVAGIMGGAAGAVILVALVLMMLLTPASTTVTINDSGRIISANTTEDTVGELLSKNGIALDDNDVLEVSLSAKLEDDMEIVIRRANTISISDEGGDTQIKMLAGTVGEALERAGIELGPKDEVYPDTATYVYAGMNINIIRVEVKYETQTEVLEYKEITRENNTVKKGQRLLMQEGKKGSQEHTIEVVYKNGEEYSREVIETKVIQEPQDEIIYIGTYVPPTPKPTKVTKPTKTQKPAATKPAAGGDTGANNPKDDEGKLTKVPSIEQIHTGTWAEHKAVPAPASSIIAKTVTATRITAYCLNKNKTATGTWPRIGTVAANPKQIPYGTKIYVPGYGYGRIEDTGSNKHSLDQLPLDLWLPTNAECRQWGSRRNVKIYILKG